jgi:uncharacterized protein YndB with AHSA1/START domain
MLTWILLGLAAIVAVVLLLITRRPGNFRIERAETVAAPPAAVMELIEDFHQWKRWSPWDKLDPTQTITIGGAPRGTGATYHWVGKKNGEGRMEIIDHHPNQHVGIQLDFIKPFASHNRCDFTLRPVAGGSDTEVTWTMTGTNNFMAKAFDLFVNMDCMVGRDFARGLAQLKEQAEATVGTRAGTPAPGQVAKSRL